MEFARLTKGFSAVKVSSRTRVCEGEEARVFRINKTRNPFFRSIMERNGLAERRHVLNEAVGKSMRWKQVLPLCEDRLRRIGSSAEGYKADEVPAQILNFYFMRLANALFPQNFPKVHALRFCKGKGGKMEARLYTEFVPDENGAIVRKEKALGKFRKLVDAGKSWDSLRIKSDAKERRICKGLEEAAKKVRAAGFIMNHYEVNYHERDGVPVFFEVDGVILMELVRYIYGMPESSQKTRANAAFAMLFGALVFAQGEVLKERGYFWERVEKYPNWCIYSRYFDGEPAFFARYLVDAFLGNHMRIFKWNWKPDEGHSLIISFAKEGYEVAEFMQRSRYFSMVRPWDNMQPESLFGTVSEQGLEPVASAKLVEGIQAASFSGEPKKEPMNEATADANTGFWEGVLNAAKRMLERSLQAVR